MPSSGSWSQAVKARARARREKRANVFMRARVARAAPRRAAGNSLSAWGATGQAQLRFAGMRRSAEIVNAGSGSYSGRMPGARHHDLLRAVTRALEVLGARGDEATALGESFAAAVQAFGAEKALLLRVNQRDPLEMESARAVGLSETQIDAAVRGRSVEGVSASLIRQAVEEGAPELVENSQLAGRRA